MYRDEWISVIYSPGQDTYILLISSTRNTDRTKLFLDQRLLDEFSRNDLEYLSSKLPLIGADHDLSRKDVKRIHGAIVGTMKKFQKNLQDFVEKQGL